MWPLYWFVLFVALSTSHLVQSRLLPHHDYYGREKYVSNFHEAHPDVHIKDTERQLREKRQYVTKVEVDITTPKVLNTLEVELRKVNDNILSSLCSLVQDKHRNPTVAANVDRIDSLAAKDEEIEVKQTEAELVALIDKLIGNLHVIRSMKVKEDKLVRIAPNVIDKVVSIVDSGLRGPSNNLTAKIGYVSGNKSILNTTIPNNLTAVDPNIVAKKIVHADLRSALKENVSRISESIPKSSIKVKNITEIPLASINSTEPKTYLEKADVKHNLIETNATNIEPTSSAPRAVDTKTTENSTLLKRYVTIPQKSIERNNDNGPKIPVDAVIKSYLPINDHFAHFDEVNTNGAKRRKRQLFNDILGNLNHLAVDSLNNVLRSGGDEERVDRVDALVDANDDSSIKLKRHISEPPNYMEERSKRQLINGLLGNLKHLAVDSLNDVLRSGGDEVEDRVDALLDANDDSSIKLKRHISEPPNYMEERSKRQLINGLLGNLKHLAVDSLNDVLRSGGDEVEDRVDALVNANDDSSKNRKRHISEPNFMEERSKRQLINGLLGNLKHLAVDSLNDVLRSGGDEDEDRVNALVNANDDSSIKLKRHISDPHNYMEERSKRQLINGLLGNLKHLAVDSLNDVLRRGGDENEDRVDALVNANDDSLIKIKRHISDPNNYMKERSTRQLINGLLGNLKHIVDDAVSGVLRSDNNEDLPKLSPNIQNIRVYREVLKCDEPIKRTDEAERRRREMPLIGDAAVGVVSQSGDDDANYLPDASLNRKQVISRRKRHVKERERSIKAYRNGQEMSKSRFANILYGVDTNDATRGKRQLPLIGNVPLLNGLLKNVNNLLDDSVNNILRSGLEESRPIKSKKAKNYNVAAAAVRDLKLVEKHNNAIDPTPILKAEANLDNKVLVDESAVRNVRYISE